MTKLYPIPPAIGNMLEKLANPRIDQVERDNVAMVLEEVERLIGRDVRAYRKTRAKQHRDDREQKRHAIMNRRLGRASDIT